MGQTRIAVLTVAGRVPAYVLDALDALPGGAQVVLVDRPAPPRRRQGRAGAARLVEVLAARRNGLPPAPEERVRARVSEVVQVRAADGLLPADVVARLLDGGVDAAVDTCAGSLGGLLPLPVLALRLGAPGYRTAPAGFWEIVRGDQAVALSVELVVGPTRRTVATAETKVHAHSWRATVGEAHRHAPLVLGRALADVLGGRAAQGEDPTAAAPAAPPSARVLVAFGAGMLRARLRRLAYGAAVEKRWQVSTAPAPADPVDALGRNALLPPPDRWRTLPIARGYVFYADPFVSEEPSGVLVEALRTTTGRGELVLVQGDDHRRVSPAGGHFSYPGTVRLGGRQYVVPETASWAPPGRYVLNGTGGLSHAGDLDLGPDARVIDPTLVEHAGSVYLFGNSAAVGSGALQLWVADAVDAPFRPHPASPVLVSPRGARMGGGLLRSGDTLLRLGQDFGSGYGDGLFVFSVDELTPTTYREHRVGELRFTDRKGPHTLNVGDGTVVFDWYENRWSLLAGVRRALALVRRPAPAEPAP